jgi:hypothetical protein
MVPTGRTRICFSLVQGCRGGPKLCRKMVFGDKLSHFNMCYFHDFRISIYCGEKYWVLFCRKPSYHNCILLQRVLSLSTHFRPKPHLLFSLQCMKRLCYGYLSSLIVLKMAHIIHVNSRMLLYFFVFCVVRVKNSHQKDQTHIPWLQCGRTTLQKFRLFPPLSL